MTHKSNLGYVHLPASYVFDRSITILTESQERREKKRLELIERIKTAPPTFFGKLFRTYKPGMTDDEALELIKTEDLLWWEYESLRPEFKPDKEKALDKLARVAMHLLGSGDADMLLSIESANWLVL